MKKIITIRLAVIILVSMLCSLVLCGTIQLDSRRAELDEATENLFWQIEEVVKSSGNISAQTEEVSERSCISRARTAARILEDEPSLMNTKADMLELAELVEAKELNIFNYEGKLVAGTNAEYFGVTFSTSEVLEDFKPMLNNHNLEVNGEARLGLDQKTLMRYAGVWLNNQDFIVCVGVESRPASSGNYSAAFELFNSEGSELYAINLSNRTVTASTRLDHEGERIEELGCQAERFSGEGGHVKLRIDGKKYWGIYKDSDSVILLRAIKESYIRSVVFVNGAVLIILLLLISLAIFAAIIRFLDKNIIRNIYDINRQLVKITQGDLDAQLPKCSTPEFIELSTYISEMMESLMDLTHKMSLVFDETELPICVYEFGPGMKRVLATNRLPEILNMTQDEVTAILSDSDLFLNKLDEMENYPIYPGSKIYRLPGSKNKYVRMEAFISDRYLMGVLIDETKSILERQLIERERDIDPLTDLYSRRAFYSQVEELLEDTGTLGHAVLMMADADGLKDVNDQHGHESGDRYLQAVADVLRSCRAKHHIAGRRSGDEFVLFIYGCATINELNAHISNVLRQRDNVMVVLKDGVRVLARFSVGLAYCPEDARDFNTMLRIADERMYMEKRDRKAGRGQQG